MAIAKMSRMQLVGLKADREGILGLLAKIGAVEIKQTEDFDNIEAFSDVNVTDLDDKIDKVSSVLTFLTENIDSYAKINNCDGAIKDGFEISFNDFVSISDKEIEMENVLKELTSLSDSLLDIKSKKLKADQKISEYTPLACINDKLSDFKNTKHTFTILGWVAETNVNKLTLELEEITECNFVNHGKHNKLALISITATNKQLESVNGVVSNYNLTKVFYKDDKKPLEIIRESKKEKFELNKDQAELEKKVYELNKYVKDIKVYLDYLMFERTKKLSQSNFKQTDSTFILEGYVPSSASEEVTKKVTDYSQSTYLEFNEIARDEFAPTLTQNKKAVKNFEFVTNLYSPPAYGGFDPNTIVAIFFSFFMGFIMADVVYGLLMVVGAGLFAKKLSDSNSTKRLVNCIFYGGIFAVIFGLLIDSFLGFQVLNLFMPESYVNFYNKYLNALDSQTSLAGIKIPMLLMYSLIIGMVQILVSLILKAIINFKRGEIVEGITQGIFWAVFLTGVIVMVIGMMMTSDLVTTIGGITAVAFAVLAVLTAGIKQKGIGKLSSSFGSAYGIINYLSDILSYSRLYGLMLSGSQIATIFSVTLAVDMLFPLGIGGIIGGVLVMILGHAFNMAMGLLGAYIHDSRLQYIEFFGRFYEGDGRLFNPLGSTHEHIVLTK